MNTILISYDLIHYKTIEQYENLIARIKKYPGWCKPLESFWIVSTKSSASEVRDELKAHIHSDDKLIAVNITGDGWASFGLSTKVTDWIKENA
jgi:hypothetical protein